MTIRTFLKYDAKKHGDNEQPYGKSMTVPDMTMSLQTLVSRYTRSGTIGEVPVFEGTYDGDVEVPHFERMTAQERLDYARQIKKNIAALRQQLTEKNKAAKEIEKAAEATIKEEVSTDDEKETKAAK